MSLASSYLTSCQRDIPRQREISSARTSFSVGTHGKDREGNFKIRRKQARASYRGEAIAKLKSTSCLDCYLNNSQITGKTSAFARITFHDATENTGTAKRGEKEKIFHGEGNWYSIDCTYRAKELVRQFSEPEFHSQALLVGQLL